MMLVATRADSRALSSPASSTLVSSLHYYLGSTVRSRSRHEGSFGVVRRGFTSYAASWPVSTPTFSSRDPSLPCQDSGVRTEAASSLAAEHDSSRERKCAILRLAVGWRRSLASSSASFRWRPCGVERVVSRLVAPKSVVTSVCCEGP